MARLETISNIMGRTFLSNFGTASNDVVVLQIFSPQGEWLSSYQVDPGDWYLQETRPDGSATENVASATAIDMEAAMTKAGFTSGNYEVRIYFLRQWLTNIPIDTVSEDFKEIRLTQGALEDAGVDNYLRDRLYHMYKKRYKLHRTLEGNTGPATFTVPLLIDEGQGDMTPVINMYKDKHRHPTYEDAQSRSVYFKLAQPLKKEGAVDINVSALMSDIINVSIKLQGVIPSEPFRLLTPNFDLGPGSSINTSAKTWDEVLGSDSTTSEQLISKYVSGSWGEGTELNIDYRDFKNFIHFSSAEERLRNFHYKMTLLEDYRTSNVELQGLSAAVPEVSGNIDQNQRKINALLNGFDGYERYMYYGSGSLQQGNIQYEPATWPKYNNTKPYCNMSSSTNDVKKWFGSADTSSPFFGGQIYSASMWDRDNQDMLIKALPAFILDDPQNSTIFTYTHMLGQHYDILFNYVNNLTSIHSREESPDEGTPREMLFKVAQSLGLQLFNGNMDNDLWSYALGTAQNGTTLQTGLGSTSGSLTTLSGKEQTEEIWNRLINNLPTLLKSKGTERSVRALVNCYGIPSSILRVVEFGGPEPEDQTSNFAINRYANALQFGNEGGLKELKKLKARRFLADGLNPKSWTGYKPLKTIEFRIQSTYKDNQTLFSEYTGKEVLALEWSSSGHDNYDPGTSPYARLVWHTSASWAPGVNPNYGSGVTAGHLSCSTDYAPILDGDWWNIMLRFPDVSGSDINGWPDQRYKWDIFAKKSAEFSSGGITHAVTASTMYVSGSTSTISKTATWGQIVSSTVGLVSIGGAETETGYWNTGNGSCTSGIKNAFGDKPFSGSMQELRFWTEHLSEAAFNQHIQNPNCIVGNHYSSSYYDLVYRYRMGTDLKTNPISGTLANNIKFVTSSHPQYPFDFGTQTDYRLRGNYVSASVGTNGGTFTDVEETYYIDMPSTVGSRPMSNKIRIEYNRLTKIKAADGEEYSTLDRHNKKEFSAMDTAPMDTNKLGIYLSPTNDINIDIANTIGNTRLDQMVGDPRDFHKNEYTELADIRFHYFQKYAGSKGIWDYIRQIQYFDGSLFKIINKFIPNKANELSGLLIEPSILERSKIENQGIPKFTNDPFEDPTIIKSRDQLSVRPIDMYQTASFSYISGEYLSYSGSIKDIRKADLGWEDDARHEEVRHMYTFTSSHDVKITDPGTSGDPFELANTQAKDNPLKVREVHGYDARVQGSRYHSQQLVTHQGTSGYTVGSMSIQPTPIWATEVSLPCITGSRKSEIYSTKEYFYSGSVSMSRHELYLKTGEWRGPYEYSRDETTDYWIPGGRGFGQNGQFGNTVGSYRNQAYSSSLVPAEYNVYDGPGLRNFDGSKLTGPDINKITKDTPDGGAVVEFFETNPNQLFSAAEATPNRGEILLSGEVPADVVKPLGGNKGDIIPGSQIAGPQGQTNGYWYNNGYEMVWVTASPPGTSWAGKSPYSKGPGNNNNTNNLTNNNMAR